MTEPRDVGKELSPLRRAFVAVETLQAKLARLEGARTEPLAIIGVGCRFPGGSVDPERFWRLLRDGVDAVSEVPRDRWDVDAVYDRDPDAPGKASTRWGAFIDDVDRFDAAFFGIAPREAAAMDPQQRLLLEVTWEALEHAGQAPDRLSGSRTGVYVGMASGDYARLALADGDPARVDAYYASGIAHSIAAGRLSYTLGLQGPSITIDTACSSSLVAVHLACQSLRSGECRMAVAGGVHLTLAPENTVAFSKARMLAPDGRCKAFDAAADGFSEGEGCGMVVLKRLSDALADGDRVLALLRGSAVNQDGPSAGLTAPSGPAQEAVIREALASAGAAPSEVAYVEAHGTGTALGDPIEVRALAAALTASARSRRLLLGSVKTNIGHLEAAAGVAGLIKVVLALQHGEIPAHLHLRTPNPHIEWGELPVEVVTARRPWPAGRRLAGVSSFGFSGTNAHVLVESAPDPVGTSAQSEPRAHVLPLSAKTEPALDELATHFERRLAEPGLTFADACFTAGTGRAQLDHRLAIVASSSSEARALLTRRRSGERTRRVVLGQVTPGRRARRIGFLFPGQGAQYAAMGRGLFERSPVFRAAVERVAAAVAGELERPLLDVLYGTEHARLEETAYTQAALFAIEWGLAELWRAWGVEPAAVVGHSVGEYAAACVTGVLEVEAAARLVAVRGRLMGALPRGGAMVAVQGDESTVASVLAEVGGGAAIAAVNGPRSVAVSGEAETVARVVRALQARAIASQALRVTHAFHSALMEPMQYAFAAAAQGLRIGMPQRTMISTVTGCVVGGVEEMAGTYWVRQVREPVRFAASVATMASMGVDVFLEAGPGTTLLGLTRQCLPDAPGPFVPSLRQDEPDWERMLASLATLWAGGTSVDWAAVNAGRPNRRVSLPTYPFQRERHWIAASPSSSDRIAKPAAQAAHPSAHPLLGRRLASPLPSVQFETELRTDSPEFLGQHRIGDAAVLPATAYLEMMGAAVEAVRPGPHALEDVTLEEPLVVGDGETRRVQVVLSFEGVDAIAVEVWALVERAGGPSWRRHARAHARPDRSGDAPVALDRVRAGLGEAFHAEAFYPRLDGRALELGPSFRGVTRVWRGDGLALGEIQLPGRVTDAGRYRMHPVVLDACIQVLAAVVADDVAAGSLFLPMAVDRFRLIRRPDGRLWSLARLTAALGDTLSADLQVLDDGGRVVAELSGLRLKRMDRGLVTAMGSGRVADWMYHVRWQALGAPILPDAGRAPASRAAAETGSRRWIILADRGGVGDRLASALRERGDDCLVLRPGARYAVDASGITVDPSQADHLRRALQEGLPSGEVGPTGAIHLWALDAPANLDEAMAEDAPLQHTVGALHAVQALLAADVETRLWLVTRGVHRLAPDAGLPAASQAPLWGLGRTIALEHPDLRCVCVDLDPSVTADPVAALLAEISDPGEEDEIAWRHGQRHAPRLARWPDGPDGIGATAAARLETTMPGSLEHLTCRPAPRRAPGPGQVEIRIRASGLNLRDVLNALDLRPGDVSPFGTECAGTIVATGLGVDQLTPGMEVVAIGEGCLSSHLTTDAALVAPRPPSLTPEQAASLPVAYVTASYALCAVGAMKPGDSVLIHAGAGGVGLAAIVLAQRCGARVLATAGSPEKRRFLSDLGVTHVFDSRSLAFRDGVMGATGGRGVDLVLNSLAGDAIAASLAVVAPGGRFLEIGKRGILDPAEAARRRPDVRYVVVDWSDAARRTPAVIRQYLVEAIEAVDSGRLPLPPVTVFPLTDAAAAFRYMAQARHIGKIVLVAPRDPAGAGCVIRPDASYLITGGFGGLGLEVARWLVERGARSLVLMGRRAPSDVAASSIGSLRKAGAQVSVVEGDVSSAPAVDRVVAEMDQGGYPLRGVIHAAGTFANGILVHQDAQRFSRVLAAKVKGTWNLERATRGLALDFFVLFSSAAALLGAPGQANHAAANVFLDAIAQHRRARGLPGLSLDWGAWSTVGAAADEDTARWIATQGMGRMRPDEGLVALASAMEGDEAQIAVLPVDWASMRARHGGARHGSLLRGLERRDPPPRPIAREPEGEALMVRLRQADPAKWHRLLAEHVARRVGRVLGLDGGRIIDPLRPLKELGIDSLMAVELRNVLKVDLALEHGLPATLVFDHPTLDAIATYLAGVLLGPAARAPDPGGLPATADGADGLLTRVERMSDDEVDRVLGERLGSGGA